MYGYEVIRTSVINNMGMAELSKALLNNTSVFAGQSGVRKINSYK